MNGLRSFICRHLSLYNILVVDLVWPIMGQMVLEELGVYQLRPSELLSGSASFKKMSAHLTGILEA